MKINSSDKFDLIYEDEVFMLNDIELTELEVYNLFQELRLFFHSRNVG